VLHPISFTLLSQNDLDSDHYHLEKNLWCHFPGKKEWHLAAFFVTQNIIFWRLIIVINVASF